MIFTAYKNFDAALYQKIFAFYKVKVVPDYFTDVFQPTPFRHNPVRLSQSRSVETHSTGPLRVGNADYCLRYG